METKAKTFTELLAAIGGAIASFFTGSVSASYCSFKTAYSSFN